MTDHDPKSRAVAARFLGWEPGKMCEAAQFDLIDEGARCVLCGYVVPGPVNARNRYHEIPPPDPRDPAVFVALLEATRFAVWYTKIGGCWSAGQYYRAYPSDGDTPADALLEAAYQLVTASPQP